MKRIIVVIGLVLLTVLETLAASPASHYIAIYAGGGMSSIGYSPEGGSAMPGGSFTVGAGYTWFFLPFMGLQTGVQCTRVGSTVSLTAPMQWEKWQNGSPLTDYMGEPYIHRAALKGWKEKEQAYLMEVPVGLRFRHFPNQDSRAGLHAALGANVAFPVFANYTRVGGEITHTGWYPQWQLELHDLPGRFETEPFVSGQEGSFASKLNIVNAEAYAELGTIIRLNQKCELFITAYACYMLNDFSSVRQEERSALGFADSHNNYTFMEPYRGLIGTDKVGAMHPWVAGIKAGVSIWPGKTDKEKKQELKKLLQQFPDAVQPTYIHDTVYIHDTICPQAMMATGQMEEEQDTEGQGALETLLTEAVIWFHYDEYVPILEPADILDSVAAVMVRYPELKIHVNGHACQLGTEGYNQRLALLRARAVAELLKQKGVPAQRMYIWSYGERKPYRYNTKKQLSKDRRVEIIPE